jgi:hypothetical protein
MKAKVKPGISVWQAASAANFTGPSILPCWFFYSGNFFLLSEQTNAKN